MRWRMVDKGATRAEILEKTGNVLGCAGANLTVNEGEISRADGPVRAPASRRCCGPSTA